MSSVEIDDIIVAKPARISLREADQRADDRSDLGAGVTRWTDGDTSMGLIRGYGFTSESREVCAIPGDKTLLLSRGDGELTLVGQFIIADLVDAGGVDAGSSQRFGNTRGKIFVEVEPQARRTRPGNLSCKTSNVREAFSSIAASTSSGNRA